MVWLGWAILRPRRLAGGLRLRPLPPVRLRMRLPSRLRGVLPAVSILSTLFLCGILPAVSTLSAVLQLCRVHAEVSVLSTGLRLCGVLPEIPILSARALLLVVGLPHTKTADGPNKRQATSAVIATALVRRCAEPGAQSGVTRAGFFSAAQSLSSPLCARSGIAASRAPYTRDQTKTHDVVGPRVEVDLGLVASSDALRTAGTRRGFAYCRARMERSLGIVVSHTQVP